MQAKQTLTILLCIVAFVAADETEITSKPPAERSFDELKANIFGHDYLENFDDTKAQLERLRELAKEKDDAETLARVEPLVDACDIGQDKCNQARGDKLIRLLWDHKATSKYLTECIDRQVKLCWTPTVISQVDSVDRWSTWTAKPLLNSIRYPLTGVLTTSMGDTRHMTQYIVYQVADVLGEYMVNSGSRARDSGEFARDYDKKVYTPCRDVVDKLRGPFEFFLDVGKVLKITRWFRDCYRNWIDDLRFCKLVLNKGKELTDLAYRKFNYQRVSGSSSSSGSGSNSKKRGPGVWALLWLGAGR